MTKPETIGETIAARLREFRQDLEALPEGAPLSALPAKYRLRTVTSDAAPPEFDAAKVKEVRGLLGLSEPRFAEFLGVSVRTVRGWESGRNAPQGVARRFMQEIAANPTYWRKRVKQAASSNA